MSVDAVRDAFAALRAVVARGRSAGVGFLAAAIAYYALVSLVPLTALVALAVAVVAGDRVAGLVVTLLGDSLSGAGREAVREVLTSATGRSRATAVGLAVLLWGAGRLFRGLDRAFARVYRTRDRDGVLGHLRDAVVTLAGVLAAAVALAGIEFVPVVGTAGGAVGAVVRVALLGLLLFPAYYVLPDAPVGVREAVPGTVLCAVGWAALYAALDLYVAATGGRALSDIVGAVVLVVTWLYAAAFLLLVGATVNAVLADRRD
ncbi:YihY/virulence factor BrkB family protein [Halobaculum sp. EA56]|uniref:YihY/virulence factor BrkB family protein n=1 Tax=Halobaculum sp. EA56 TaxID=3421648 RepID=UPI003EBEBAF6